VPEIRTTLVFTLTITDVEFNLLTKGLALVAGIPGPRIVPEDKPAASQLNQRMLDLQASTLREKLAVAERKMRGLDPATDAEPE